MPAFEILYWRSLIIIDEKSYSYFKVEKRKANYYKLYRDLNEKL